LFVPFSLLAQTRTAASGTVPIAFSPVSSMQTFGCADLVAVTNARADHE
jgi:hypothetical protein